MKTDLVISERKTTKATTEAVSVEIRDENDRETTEQHGTKVKNCRLNNNDGEDEKATSLGILKGGRWGKTIRFLTLTGCLLVVAIQLSQCYAKLTQPPVTTHTRFHVNDSLWYPALTLCREPPFRMEVLFKYGLGASTRYTSEWRNFPWGQVTLNQLFMEATYPAQEVLLLYGLNGLRDNVDVASSYFFQSGLCHTLTPKTSTEDAGLDVGYSILMSHSGIDTKAASVPGITNDNQFGWHVFVHEPSEKWTENKMQSYGRQEALFVEVGAEVHLRVSVQEFLQTSVGQNRHCINGVEDGEVRCAERCRWEQIAVAEGCSVPWFPGVDLPQCDSYNKTRKLIVDYLRFDSCTGDCCGCGTECRMVKYEVLPITKKAFPEPMSQIYVFFNSRLVTLLEERPAYDWSTFVAEMGGNLGFLLGLSVLGVINILEQAVETITTRIPLRCCKA